MQLKKLADEIINGRRLGRNDDLSFFFDCDLQELCSAADNIREKLCGSHVDLCSIINGRSGRCTENCKFCAQAACHHTGIDEYGFLDNDAILKECKHNEERGVHRFSIVTAGRTLSDKEFEKAISAYRLLKKECGSMKLCASYGLLTYEQLKELKDSGVTNYHANIETSRRNFPNICTTHTYDDKTACIKRAQKAGLNVCSGGIIGMGETWEDRLDMALSLSELGIRSIPINALIPIEGTSLDGIERISSDDILRTVSMFRFIVPEAYIRLAAGRSIIEGCGEAAFKAGANAAITGDMLTTSGNDIISDIKMLDKMGFDTERA